MKSLRVFTFSFWVNTAATSRINHSSNLFLHFLSVDTQSFTLSTRLTESTLTIKCESEVLHQCAQLRCICIDHYGRLWIKQHYGRFFISLITEAETRMMSLRENDCHSTNSASTRPSFQSIRNKNRNVISNLPKTFSAFSRWIHFSAPSVEVFL